MRKQVSTLFGSPVIVDDTIETGTMYMYTKGQYETIVHHEGKLVGQTETVEIKPPSVAMITNIGKEK